MGSSWLLLAQTTLRTNFELTRLQSYTERWHFLVLGLACALLAAFVVFMYRRDSVELRPGIGWVLAALRVAALLGLLAYYLQLEKRTERSVTHNSRVLVLVDTSLSMGLHDADSTAVPAKPNRLEQVADVLDQGKLLHQLREKHDVVLVHFDADTNRVVSLSKLPVQGAAPTGDAANDPADATDTKKTAVPAADAKEDTAWRSELVPRGVETRLGQALHDLINDERANPVAGIVLFSDGGQNAGVDPAVAIEAAREARIPIYTVGIGSDHRPANVRISDLVAPSRAYPGDSFSVTGYIQAQEMAGRTVSVELSSRPAGEGAVEQARIEGSENVVLGKNGEVSLVKFEISPTEKGRRTFRLAIKAPPDDTNSNDDQQEADVEIVDRKTKVLLVASGPTREYVFLRNQLHRDKQIIADVWLQSAPPGVSQDANKILDAFPSSVEELFEYDCIIGFDPDWTALSGEQIEMLERWVAEKAGGLIVVAGPVETDRWVREAKDAKIRDLYPVEFNRHLSLIDDARFGSDVPWPVDFTREGMEAEFLWLTENGARSRQIWTSFPGVFGYYSVRGAKQGATVYARYSDPQAANGDQQPVYMAGQFYGAGRVFYLGSGEMWRLRAIADGYFEQFYTKLVRHVSQGRLLLGSRRGMLLVDRDRYLLGNTVAVRAQLSDAKFTPLDVPSVPLQIVNPDSTVQTLTLMADKSRKGMYAGQFTALGEGTYRLELTLPEGGDEPLTRRIQVKVPDLERENPQRNDALLSEIAKSTGGTYFVGAATVLGSNGSHDLASQLKDRTEITFLPGVTDREFEEKWMRDLLFFICGALSCEWLLRRLCKLA